MSFEINFEIPSTNFGQIHKDAISESLTGLYETLHRLDSAYDFAILCSKRTRLTSPDRIKSPFIIELGIFHGTDTHRIGISH